MKRVRLLLDVPNKLVTLGLELVDPVLDDVADADDRVQLAIDHDRYVADAQVGHGAGQLVDLDIRPTRLDVGRHDRAHGRQEHGCAVTVQVAHDVTLADDAGHAFTVVAHDEGTDAVLGEQVEQPFHGLLGADGDHLATLATHDIRDPHAQTVDRREGHR